MEGFLRQVGTIDHLHLSMEEIAFQAIFDGSGHLVEGWDVQIGHFNGRGLDTVLWVLHVPIGLVRSSELSRHATTAVCADGTSQDRYDGKGNRPVHLFFPWRREAL